MSIAAQCPDCCTCPTPSVEWDSVSVSISKCGFLEWTGFASSPPKVYSILTEDGHRLQSADNDCDVDLFWDEATTTHNKVTCAVTYGGGFSVNGDSCLDAERIRSDDQDAGFYYSVLLSTDDCSTGFTYGARATENITSSTVKTVSDDDCAGSITLTLSDEYLTSELITNALAGFPSFPGTWSGTAGSFRNLSTDEISFAARKSRYRLPFEIPKVGSGTCYRVEWVERFIAEAGVSLDSAEIVTRGVYRPTVTVTGDGTGAEVVAAMASDGTLDFYHVLNPGEGYTTITITAQAAINGGTTATGTGNLVAGQLASVTKTASGNYLPTGAFSGGGGTGATITFTMDETGGLATCPLGSGGTGYTSEPTLTITPKVSGSLAARVDLHLGTETARCAVWDGEIPEDYDPEDEDTWPILGDGTNPYFELPVPEADGTTLVANVRAYCDCAACP